MKNMIMATVLAAVSACSSAPTGAPASPESEHGERVAADEDALNEEITALTLAVLKKEAAARGLMTRDVHAKAHGCVRATFKIAPDVPTELRAGVFSSPGKEYPAWIRFSNGSSKVQADKKADARGMAIKLMGVEGDKLLEAQRKAGTQDFLLLTHDAFFVKDARDYADFFRRLARGSNPAWFFFGRLPWRWKEFRAASQLVKKGRISNPLLAPYFSATPYLLGERNVVKYAVQPCAVGTDRRVPFKDGPDFLRLNMRKSLDVKEGAPACFQFMVQRRSAPGAMSVEDSRVPWDRDRSKFLPVATLIIPVQEFSSEGRTRFCENLSFTPWHSLPAHRPLGGINRTRKPVYEAVSAFRREFNRVSRREPDADENPD